MTDIVKRGREYARNLGGSRPEDYLTWQMADEIERLRAKIIEGGPEDDWEERGAAGEMRAEIERLRAEIVELKAAMREGQE